jgi:Na+/H+-dicarboxylate symporter
MGKAIALATPFFFLLIGIEWLVARVRGVPGVYRLNDAINSLSLGVMSQVLNVFMRVLAIGIYALVFQHVALGEWPQGSVVGLGARDRFLRLLLLLESPARS